MGKFNFWKIECCAYVVSSEYSRIRIYNFPLNRQHESIAKQIERMDIIKVFICTASIKSVKSSAVLLNILKVCKEIYFTISF